MRYQAKLKTRANKSSSVHVLLSRFYLHLILIVSKEKILKKFGKSECQNTLSNFIWIKYQTKSG